MTGPRAVGVKRMTPMFRSRRGSAVAYLFRMIASPQAKSVAECRAGAGVAPAHDGGSVRCAVLDERTFSSLPACRTARPTRPGSLRLTLRVAASSASLRDAHFCNNEMRPAVFRPAHLFSGWSFRALRRALVRPIVARALTVALRSSSRSPGEGPRRSTAPALVCLGQAASASIGSITGRFSAVPTAP